MFLKKRFNKESIRVALIFFIFSILWIFFSDKLLYSIVKDSSEITNIQTIKGFTYVFLASFFIYIIVFREINKKDKALVFQEKKNEWLSLLVSNLPNIEVILFDINQVSIFIQGKGFLIDDLDIQSFKMEKNYEKRFEITGLQLSKIKETILKGVEYNTSIVFNNNFLDIKGRTVYDEDRGILAGLIVIINISEQKRMMNQLEVEKSSYSSLFKEYHSVNLELKKSYENLKTKNKEIEDSNERYQNFFMQTTEGVYRVDFPAPISLNLTIEEQMQQILETGYLAECNPVFAFIYGIEEPEKLYGKKLLDFLNISTIKQHHELIQHLVSNNYRTKNFRTVEPLESGDKYFTNNLIAVISDNQLMRIWGTKVDITRQNKYEKDLILAKKIAEDSDKLKSAFLANMSHEIRTPLNGILGFSELLCGDKLTKEQQVKYKHIIKNSNTQLLRIIDDILDISRIETGQLSINKEKFHLNELILEIEFYLIREIEKRQKPIEASSFTNLSDNEDYITVDKQRLYQVITNLLNNSVKFTEKGKIEFGYKKLSNFKLEFFVKDTGIGIANKDQKAIFKQFKQVEDYVARKHGGTGLGLAISKGIVELMNGKISVDSRPGQGAIFSFTIPYEKGDNP